jgi:DNA repair protein RadC
MGSLSGAIPSDGSLSSSPRGTYAVRENKMKDMWANGLDTEAQILEAAERIMEKRLVRQGKISEPCSAAGYIRAHCGHLEHEVFGCIFLDNRHSIIAIEDLFRGTIDGAEVYPREVAKRCLHHNAAALIIFHCHPSGNLTASAADFAVTQRLKEALALFEIRILDHFIVSNEPGYTSLAAMGRV